MRLENQLHDLIEKLAGDYIGVLRELITIPSVLGDEGNVQKRIKSQMRDLGVFEREIFAGSRPPYVPSGRSYDGRPSLVGRVRGRGNRHFILNAHADTAPVEDVKSWTHPPFAAEAVDGKLYGRGALDDKAGLAMMLLIAECVCISGVKLPGDILLESVIEDEDTGNGTLALTQNGYRADAAIVIDGTWPFRIIDAHLGQIWVRFEVQGVPVASCSCRRGVNPISIGGELIRTIEGWVNDTNQSLNKWLNIAQPFFVNVGTFHSGCWPGGVPERATFDLQIGFPPPWTPEQVLAECQRMATEIQKREERGRIQLTRGSLWTTPHANVDNVMAQRLKATIRRLRPGEMEPINQAVMGHCDLRHLRRADGSFADACLYGPGGGGNPHAPDEFYHLDHFVPVAQNIVSAILDFHGLT